MCFCANEGASRSKCAELHVDAYVISRIYYEIYCFLCDYEKYGVGICSLQERTSERARRRGEQSNVRKKGGCFPGKV